MLHSTVVGNQNRLVCGLNNSVCFKLNSIVKWPRLFRLQNSWFSSCFLDKDCFSMNFN